MVQSKRTFLLITTGFVISCFLLSGIAYAGGWHKIGPKEGNVANTFDPDAGLWSDNSAGFQRERIPHLDLSTSSNKCRTCHAVHNADNVNKDLGYDSTDPDLIEDQGSGQAFKLLRNESRASECEFCHGPNGALSNPARKPYAPMLVGPTVIPAKGMHTLGAEEIPDSTVDDSFLSSTGGLSCGNCHSVHGGWTLNDVGTAGTLGTRILRRDPAQNGNDSDPANDDSIGNGAAGGVINVQDQGNGNKAILGQDLTNPLSEEEHLASFCGDCHNKNVNWDRGGAGIEGMSTSLPGVSEGERPNKFAHPMGYVDGLIDIYGKLQSVEAVPPTKFTCSHCHASRGTSPSKFPHKSVGHKLLANTYTDESSELDPAVAVPPKPTNYLNWLDAWDIDPGTGAALTDAYTGNPNRPLPNLDAKVCRGCHSFIGQPDNPDSF